MGLEIQVEQALIEMDVGDADGMPYPEMRERYPEFLREWMSDRVADAQMPGGECLAEVQERAWSTIDQLRARWPEAKVAVVTHNFVILTLLCRVLDLPLARFRRLRHELAAVSVVELRDDRTVLVAMNDRSHLGAAGLA